MIRLDRTISVVLCISMILFLSAQVAAAQLQTRTAQDRRDHSAAAVGSSHILQIGGAAIQVDFAPGPFDLDREDILKWVEGSAQAVTIYYGRFPVSRARILIVPVGGERGVVQGTTWGDRDGFQGFTRMRVGQQTTLEDLSEDWMLTHEMTHMALASLPDKQHWLEEGLATYVEPIARAQAGQLAPEKVWGDMVRDMPKGEPAIDDRGLDQTHTWGRTYWGGAMFCLVADVEIRRQTGNRKSLQDALRAIVASGNTIDKDDSLPHVLIAGDRATGTTVLTEMYKTWKDKPIEVDLSALWNELGIQRDGVRLRLSSTTALAGIRQAITAAHK